MTRLDPELPSNQVTKVDAPRVAEAVAVAWQKRVQTAPGPIWMRPNHGLAPFDFAQPVEEARWMDLEEDALDVDVEKEKEKAAAAAARSREQRVEL